MSKPLDEQIFDGLKEKKAGNNPEVFTPTVAKDIDKFFNKITVKAGATGFEETLTGSKLAAWIQPLHFESNLNAALDSLEAAESLLNEARSRLLAKIQTNFVRAMLIKDDGADEFAAILADNTTLVEQLELDSGDEYYQNLTLRISKKLLDLIEYSKAAKLGAKVLFGLKVDEPSEKFRGIGAIREPLRQLLEKYRELGKSEQEVVLPISLKKAKDDAGNYLVAKWKEATSEDPTVATVVRTEADGLNQESLKFDLSKFSEIAELQFERIRRVGVQILDSRSLNSEASAADPHPNFWNVVLSDQSEGLPLGGGDALEKKKNRFSLSPVKYGNIAGSKNSGSIVWSRYDSLLNFSSNREWLVEISGKSHNGQPVSEVRDVILHFHLAHQI